MVGGRADVGRRLDVQVERSAAAVERAGRGAPPAAEGSGVRTQANHRQVLTPLLNKLLLYPFLGEQ